ncbi:tRNA (adenosine(37)-N6)-threonylcarbamoyltransferase complex ATPase subunit type 1 TsaE [bacterium]|nr:tRNA (adenosine(37)-N6)-threonylcarbamoyltransferase complex ATPase subunit type 1 TsaE [bacterium]NCQ55470.1 tRNA (adenosine(37)-N6)-threonylcarbamoyltransferase complex ATPase subunit type 1 TsaE [Candidatus Parcubacteria bacterium]NCS67832.1 tRNA (adenosine(37)-N6)-threonylcarbamoyltransferase complex ATPase subunit type 1 TsaE [Candidatus Peregrinibacteria bacterium]NCS96354.1 tRNA (adenosine(37)-N6)-threonylcarbamoyltransferase complex ATPase subunit type 1 TsaE [bacterium]
MQKIFTRSIPNQEAMRKLAADLCENFFPKNESFTLFLEGGLGAGKTFLAKEIMRLKGVSEAITSPTYALVNEYNAEHGTIGHWDFYRLEEANDFFARGFQDLANQADSSHLVEWPERLNPEAKACFSGKRFVITIDFGLGVGLRKVKLLRSE